MFAHYTIFISFDLSTIPTAKMIVIEQKVHLNSLSFITHHFWQNSKCFSQISPLVVVASRMPTPNNVVEHHSCVQRKLTEIIGKNTSKTGRRNDGLQCRMHPETLLQADRPNLMCTIVYSRVLHGTFAHKALRSIPKRQNVAAFRTYTRNANEFRRIINSLRHFSCGACETHREMRLPFFSCLLAICQADNGQCPMTSARESRSMNYAHGTRHTADEPYQCSARTRRGRDRDSNN